MRLTSRLSKSRDHSQQTPGRESTTGPMTALLEDILGRPADPALAEATAGEDYLRSLLRDAQELGA